MERVMPTEVPETSKRHPVSGIGLAKIVDFHELHPRYVDIAESWKIVAELTFPVIAVLLQVNCLLRRDLMKDWRTFHDSGCRGCCARGGIPL